MSTTVDNDQHLEAIYEFANLIAASARSGRQRERMAKATGVPDGLVTFRVAVDVRF